MRLEAVPRKGYRLVESPDVLSEAELRVFEAQSGQANPFSF